MNNELNVQLLQIRDIKRQIKGTLALALGSGLLLTTYNLLIHLHLSFLVGAGFTSCIILLLVFNQEIKVNDLKLMMTVVQCSTLLVITYLEGLGTGYFYYFFPLLIILSSVFEENHRFGRTVRVLAFIFIFSFALCLMIGAFLHPLERIDPANTKAISFINLLISFFLTAFFVYRNVQYARGFIDLIQQTSHQAGEARTKFLSTMGHELRTPMNGMLGVIQILHQEQKLASQQQCLDHLSTCSNQLQLILNNILDFNKIEGGKMEINLAPVHLEKLLLRALGPFEDQARKKNLLLRLYIDPQLAVMVQVDESRLEQIIQNLSSNALKFTAKGEINLVVQCTGKQEGKIDVHFSMEDSGAGIAVSHQAMLFENHWQMEDNRHLRSTGAGLGLSITKRLLDLMCSTLEVESTPGEGSRFFFTLRLPVVYEGDSFRPTPGLGAPDTPPEMDHTRTSSFRPTPVIADSGISAENTHERISSYRLTPALAAESVGDSRTVRDALLRHGRREQSPEPIKPAASTIKQGARLRGVSILLVEDNEINIFLAKKTLMSQEASIEVAVNGEEALQILRRGSSAKLILLDLAMPVMDGYTAIQYIREMNKKIPIVAFTASLIDPEQIAYLYELGFTDYLLKPYKAEKLIEMAEHYSCGETPYTQYLPASTRSASTTIPSTKTTESTST